MASNIVRARSAGMPSVGTRDGNWMWDGSNWVCDPDCNGDGFPPFGPPVFSGPTQQPPWYPGANGGVSFGAQPPPNPVRGHLFWDGKTFWLFDGAAWVAVGGPSTTGTPPSSTAPANPVPGQQWFNGSTLFVWDGNAWVPVSQTKTFIQATAPPAPNPGDTWWDGVQFRIWDGSVWQAVGPGATLGPVATTTLMFALTTPADLTLPGADAWGLVPFTTVPITDTLHAWNAGQSKYLPTRPGIYSFMLRGAFASGGALAILKNDPGVFTGGTSSDIIIGIAGSASSDWTAATGFAQMNGTTDYVRAWARGVGGIMYAAGSNPVFTATALP